MARHQDDLECVFATRELPKLRPRIAGEKLPLVTLIVAIYDHDLATSDDLLGVALVPLCPPGYAYERGAAAGAPPEEYEITVEQPLLHGNVDTGVGEISMKLTVSWGKALDAALEAADRDGLGVEAKNLSHYTRCGMFSPRFLACLPGY